MCVNRKYFGCGKSSFKVCCFTAFNNNNDIAYFWEERGNKKGKFLPILSFLSLTRIMGGVNHFLAKIVKSQLNCKFPKIHSTSIDSYSFSVAVKISKILSSIDRVWLKPFNISSKLLSIYKVPQEKHGQLKKSKKFLVFPWEN